jgi:AcrR family transcriptional regulator
MLLMSAACHATRTNATVALHPCTKSDTILAVAAVDPELIRATEAVVDRHGWGGVTAELIAEAAGINRVTLYRRGLSTSELLAAAAAAAAAEFRGRALEALAAPGSAAQRLDALLDRFFRMADDHLALLAGLYDGPTALFHLTGSGDTDAAVITRLEYTEPFERLLRDGQHDGTLTSDDPHGDAELIFNAAGWTYIHFRRSHGWSPRRARTAVVKLIDAFVTPPSS